MTMPRSQAQPAASYQTLNTATINHRCSWLISTDIDKHIETKLVNKLCRRRLPSLKLQQYMVDYVQGSQCKVPSILQTAPQGCQTAV
jgi:hypothetical protein